MAMVEVNVDLGDFEDDELIEELEDRGYTVSDKDEEEDEDEVSETSRKRMPSSYTIKR